MIPYYSSVLHCVTPAHSPSLNSRCENQPQIHFMKELCPLSISTASISLLQLPTIITTSVSYLFATNLWCPALAPGGYSLPKGCHPKVLYTPKVFTLFYLYISNSQSCDTCGAVLEQTLLLSSNLDVNKSRPPQKTDTSGRPRLYVCGHLTCSKTNK